MKLFPPKPIILAATLLFIFVNNNYSQVNADGIPFIKNYDISLYKADEANWSVTQDHRGVMYFGNNETVIEYDGSNWVQIDIPGQKYIYSLATGHDGKVYVGAVDEFGVLETDNKGKKAYKSLKNLITDSSKVTRVWKIYAEEDFIYFCTNHHIYQYEPSSKSLKKTIKLNKSNFWTFIIDGIIYSSNYEQGLLTYKDEQFKLVKGGDFYKNRDIFSLLKWSDNELLIGTHDLGLSIINIETGNTRLFDNNKIEKITNSGLRDAHIYNGIKLNKDYYAFSTMYNGVYVINKEGATVLHLDEERGLQSNVATNLYYAGNNEGILWTTLARGISSINFLSPIREFSTESGLDGALYGLTEYEGQYYVASMMGIFKMTKSTEKGAYFKKIEDVEGEIMYALVNYKAPDGKKLLLAASVKDVYVIKNESARKLDIKVESNVLLPSKTNPERVYVGTAGGIRLLEYKNGEIKYDSLTKYGDIDQYISRLVEDKNGNIWSNTLSKKQHFNSIGEKLPIPKTIEKKNGIFFGLNQDVFFGTENAIYKYNYSTKDFELYNPLSKLYIQKEKNQKLLPAYRYLCINLL